MILAPERDVQRARELVFAHSLNPIAYQILNPGIQHWFSHEGDALIGYITCNRIRVVAGAPVCSPERINAVVDRFESEATRAKEAVCYFHAGPRFAKVVRNSRGHSIAAIGALPYWNPVGWDAILRRDASLRYQISRARHKGISASEMPAVAAAESQELREIRQEWLNSKHLPPLHFLIEPDIFGELADRRLFVAIQKERIIAYLLCSPMPNRRGWLFEQWAHAARAPLGTSELLVHTAMSTFAQEKFQEVTMGLAPLSGAARAPGEPGPFWLQGLFRFMRATANPLYNFKGLEHYKYKFRPHYSEPAYAVVNNSHFRPANVFAIARAFAGSPLQLFARRTFKQNLERLIRG